MGDEQKRDYKDQESPDFVDDLSEGGGHKYYVKIGAINLILKWFPFFGVDCGTKERKK